MGPFERFSKKYKGKLLHLWVEEYLGFVTRSLPGAEGILIRRLVYRSLLKSFGKSSLIYAGVYLTHTYGIEIGNNFSINSGALVDGRGGIKIGNHVMVGPYSVIVSSRHQFEQTDVPMTALDHVMQPVIIEDDVWIGTQAFIKGGITIGRGSVVSAGAKVISDVPDFAVVAGVPANVTGSRKSATQSNFHFHKD